MAFYSTDPFANLVGPGIGRAEYGGFLMSLPPRRMFDVWNDPDYDLAETQAGAPAAGGPGLLDSPARGVRGRQAAALDLPHHRRAPGPVHPLRPHRPAFPGQAEEDPRGSRAGQLRSAGETAKEYIW